MNETAAVIFILLLIFLFIDPCSVLAILGAIAIIGGILKGAEQ